MAELKLSGSALGVTGLISLRLRGKMENQYYQKKELENLTQPAASIPSAYEKDFSPEDKEKILKDFYANMNAFYEIIYGGKSN